MITYAVSEMIDEALTVGDIINAYLPQKGKVPRGHGRIPCPFHHGKHNNLSYEPHKWYCFVCGERGNIISFVQRLYNIDYKTAASKINEDFNLGLDLSRKLTGEERARMLRRQRDEMQKRRGERKQAVRRLDNLYDLQERVYYLKRDIKRYRPAPGDTELDPRYVAAISECERLSYELLNMEW